MDEHILHMYNVNTGEKVNTSISFEMALENFFIYNKYNHLTAYYGYQMHKDHSYLLIVKKTSYFQILYHQQQ